MIYGYVRVSSQEQNLARQVIEMKKAGVEKIYEDKQSGKDFQRPQYKALYRKLKAGDVLYVLSLDRLGRNYEEIQNQWRLITKQKGADIVVIDMPILDTRKHKDLLGTFIADLILQVLAYVAHTERTNIHERQAQGIAAAKARGVKFGRPRKELPPNFYEMARRWHAGEISCTEAAQQCKMPLEAFRSRVYRGMGSKTSKTEFVARVLLGIERSGKNED